MKNTAIFYLAAILLISCNVSAQKSCPTYDELSDPKPAGAGWQEAAPGLNARFASIDVRYAKHTPPAVSGLATAWTGTAWKSERLCAQMVLWSAESIEHVELEASKLKSDKMTIEAEAVCFSFVRYTMTDEFAGGCGYRKSKDFDSLLSADVLDNIECIDLEARSVRPVWISIDIPRDAETGIYKGEISVTALQNGKKVKKRFPISVEVLDRTLPEAASWTFHLDLWQHPSAVARWHKVPVWSDQHFEYMRPLFKRLADAGQKAITATMNKDPWNVQTYDRYEDMILWTRQRDGSWEYDYTAFDRWVEFMMDLGITKQINCYSLVPWNNELHYLDQTTGKMATIQAIAGKPEFEQMWVPFITDFKAHLQSKSWLEITNIAMDERSPEEMKRAIGFMQKYAPELGIALSDNHKSYKEYPSLREISVEYSAKVEPEDLALRKANGLNTIYYVCCSDKFPNAFTFSPPAESAYNIWFAISAGYDGFSRWAYNSWVANPLLDTRFRAWPAGDTNYVYPNNRSSIRFERLIEGMQFAEKLRILTDEFNNSDNPAAKVKAGEIEDMLNKFTLRSQSADQCGELIRSAKELVNELSR